MEDIPLYQGSNAGENPHDDGYNIANNPTGLSDESLHAASLTVFGADIPLVYEYGSADDLGLPASDGDTCYWTGCMQEPYLEGDMSTSHVKTRFLILSDTHGMEFTPETQPLQHADVAIHCGDLTNGSKLEEFQSAIKLLENLNTPLKLVIAGNHDFTLDIPNFKKKVAEAQPALDPDLVKKVYGDYGQAKQLFKDAASKGIILLDEGMHHFTLQNGALLMVYASPFTPSLGDWGFQYSPNEGHHFSIDEKGVVDVVMTHGPPKGVMDYTASRQRAGCPHLFEAIARSQPRIHCFGHIHEGWGAKLVKWRSEISEKPSHFADIDNERSVVVEKLSTLRGSKFDTADTADERKRKLAEYREQRCYMTSHCASDPNPAESGQTLFINAAIEGIDEEHPVQLPWLIDIDLGKANQGSN
ncbi:hypothetical protein FQN52_002322 [Onygenales sp. PD_12]|nr:hypothetical protein FQN52_002322 [Onygenales sp. PD_12]